MMMVACTKVKCKSRLREFFPYNFSGIQGFTVGLGRLLYWSPRFSGLNYDKWQSESRRSFKISKGHARTTRKKTNNGGGAGDMR